MALIFTALLGIAGYVVQSKNATAADRAQHEIVQEAADREQTRGLAAIQLERVRTMLEQPTKLYGREISSNYQGQGLKLSKHFRV